MSKEIQYSHHYPNSNFMLGNLPKHPIIAHMNQSQRLFHEQKSRDLNIMFAEFNIEEIKRIIEEIEEALNKLPTEKLWKNQGVLATIYIDDFHKNLFVVLEKSIKENNRDFLKYLLNKGVDIDKQYFHNMPPSNILEVAVKNNKLEIVKYLIEQGAKFFDDNHISLLGEMEYGSSALDIALESGFNEIAIYLITQLPQEAYDNLVPKIIPNTITHDNIAIIKSCAEFIHNKANKEELLEKATQDNSFEIMSYLVENGANITHNAIKIAYSKENQSYLKYLLACSNIDLNEVEKGDGYYKDFSESEEISDEEQENIDLQIEVFVKEINSIFAHTLEEDIICNFITIEDLRIVKAIFKYRIENEGYPVNLIAHIEKINDLQIARELKTIANSFRVTDKEEIGKKIEPMFATLLHENNPIEFTSMVPYSLLTGITIATMKKEASDRDSYEKYPEYKTKNCFGYIINPKNFKQVLLLLSSRPEQTEQMLSILNNQFSPNLDRIIYTNEDMCQLKDVTRRFRSIDPEVLELLSERHQKCNILEEQLSEYREDKSTFVSRISSKRKYHSADDASDVSYKSPRL
ncbi:Ankyrin repeat protein [Rickettsiales bacterium Ac37b]|nr:Ankyrin repeat protein [Rickettsiales bacterium Ac37b]